MVADTVLTPQQIDDAQEAAFLGLMEEGYNGGMGGRQWDRASARAIEQAVLQSPEVQKLRSDRDSAVAHARSIISFTENK